LALAVPPSRRVSAFLLESLTANNPGEASLSQHRSRWPRVSARVIAIWVGACALLGGFFGTQAFLIASQLQNRPVTWGQALSWGLATWLLWGVLAAPIAALARRFAFGRRSWPVALAVHVPASALIALLHMTLVTSWYWFLESPDRAAYGWSSIFRFQ